VNQRGDNVRQNNDNSSDNAQEYREDRGDALMKYAMLLADATEGAVAKKGGSNPRIHVENIVKGIIEGEVRVLVSAMTMEEIFSEREMFKKRIFKNIQAELDQFGLKIYNANVKELRDAPESAYFESLSRKAHEGATNQARIDVAEAQLRGNVGEAKRKGEQDREIAKINAETSIQRTQRDAERAAAESSLNVRQAELNKEVEIARVEAQRALELRDEDLKKEVQLKRAGAEMERLRARDVVQATIEREGKQQAADARAYEVEMDAKANFEKSARETDARAYRTKQEADTAAAAAQTRAEADLYAAQRQADADFFAGQRKAEADLFAAQKRAEAHFAAAQKQAEGTIATAEADLIAARKRAEGTIAMAEAYGKMAQAFGSPAALLQYMMVEKGTFQDLAKANAQAVHGMQPKISVWTTGAEGGAAGGNPATDTMRNMYQMLPPLMTTINEQTGITLPEWQFGKLNAAADAVREEKKVNGVKAM
jgi:flotillin